MNDYWWIIVGILGFMGLYILIAFVGLYLMYRNEDKRCPECGMERFIVDGHRKKSLEAMFGGCNACAAWVDGDPNPKEKQNV